MYTSTSLTALHSIPTSVKKDKVFVDRDISFRFYYADERNPDGSNVGRDISGEAHAEFYYTLAKGSGSGEQGQRPWLQTFVKGVGYKEF